MIDDIIMRSDYHNRSFVIFAVENCALIVIKSLKVACNFLKKSNEIQDKPVGNKDAFGWRRLTWIANYNMMYRFTTISYNYGATLLALRAPL